MLITGLRGSTFTSATGAKMWFTPIRSASAAVALPCSSASDGSPVAATAIAGGHHVASVKRIPIPASRSALISSGTRAIDCSSAFTRAASSVVD